MTEVTFKPGDVVELVSGSVPMAVIWAELKYGSMKVYCQWAEKTKSGQDVKGEEFPPTVLRHVTPRDKV